MDKAQQEAEDALEAWDNEVTREAGPGPKPPKRKPKPPITTASSTSQQQAEQKRRETLEGLKRRAQEATAAEEQPEQEEAAKEPTTMAAKASRHKLALAFWAVVAVILVRAVIIAAGQHTPSVPGPASTTTSSQAAVSPPAAPTPQPASLPRRANESFDVTPAFESAGSTSKNEYRYNSQEVQRHLTLDAELEGFLLKVNVNIAYSPAGASGSKNPEEITDESGPSLEQIVSKSCVSVATPQASKEHAENPEAVTQPSLQELQPNAVHLVQHGLDVSGALLYPAVLPGEYKFGCGVDESAVDNITLGNVTTPNLGVSGRFVVYEVRHAATDTVVLFGGLSHIQEWADGGSSADLAASCVSPQSEYNQQGSSNRAIHPSHIKLYRDWPYPEAGGYGPMVGTLTFPVGAARIEQDSFYPECKPEEEESGLPLTNSEE